MKDKYIFREQFRNSMYVMVTFFVMFVEWKALVLYETWFPSTNFERGYWMLGLLVVVGLISSAIISFKIVNYLYKRLFE